MLATAYRTLGLVLASATLTISAHAEIKESDLWLFGDMKKYQHQVVIMLNRLAATHPACKQRIDPATAGISQEGSKPGNPAFFVQCGDRNIPEVVRFNLSDIKTNKTPTAARAIDLNSAHRTCRNEARRRALIPESVSFSDFFDVDFKAYPNGNAVFASTFKAKNAFGNQLKYRITCWYDGTPTMTSVQVKPVD